MLNEVKIINANEISAIFLSTHNYKDYQKILENFQSRNRNINRIVNERPSIIDKKYHEYDNRDTVIIFLTRINNKDEMIGYVSFAASSLKDSGLNISIPSVIINTFAISEKFSKKHYTVLLSSMNEKGESDKTYEFSCASFILEYLMDTLNELSSSIGITHVYLYAEPVNGVIKFYKDNHFIQFTSDIKAFNIINREYCFIRTLDNAKYRKFGSVFQNN